MAAPRPAVGAPSPFLILESAISSPVPSKCSGVLAGAQLSPFPHSDLDLSPQSGRPGPRPPGPSECLKSRADWKLAVATEVLHSSQNLPPPKKMECLGPCTLFCQSVGLAGLLASGAPARLAPGWASVGWHEGGNWQPEGTGNLKDSCTPALSSGPGRPAHHPIRLQAPALPGK